MSIAAARRRNLILAAAATDNIDVIRELRRHKVETYIAANARIVSLIVTIGVPVIRERDRPPRADPWFAHEHSAGAGRGSASRPLDRKLIDKYAETGWGDLRVSNFETWKERLSGIDSPNVEHHGSAALDVKGYPGDRFLPGDIVGWLLTNEPDEQGMGGRPVVRATSPPSPPARSPVHRMGGRR